MWIPHRTRCTRGRRGTINKLLRSWEELDVGLTLAASAPQLTASRSALSPPIERISIPLRRKTGQKMAFVSGAALPFRGATRGSNRCVRMAVLNADESKKMKEIYPVTVGSKAPVCRCWQSKKFPLCDGSHNAYNKETGSHIGPLVISATPKE